MATIRVIDSHTAGEPTRVVIESDIDLGSGPLSERVTRFRERFDDYRRAIVLEPRGSEVIVGALLCEPHRPDCDFGVIFFNNVDYLGMCGHGMIGLVETLQHLGRLGAPKAKIDTPVGPVGVERLSDGSVSVANVTSYRKAHAVSLDVPGLGSVIGDVAWGGNWFFLLSQPSFDFEAQGVVALKEHSQRILAAVHAAGFPEVDHVELFAAQPVRDSDSQNFVLCPGGEYDRSPCGTGTSAKLACLAADRKVAPGQTWIQAGVLGTSFRACYQWADSSETQIDPIISGRAFVTADSTLILQDEDPFRWGVPGVD